MAGDTDMVKTDKTELNEEKKEVDKKETDQKTEFKFNQRPEERHGWEAFSHFVWDPENKKFLGRTGMSWCKYKLSSAQIASYKSTSSFQ